MRGFSKFIPRPSACQNRSFETEICWGRFYLPMLFFSELAGVKLGIANGFEAFKKSDRIDFSAKPSGKRII